MQQPTAIDGQAPPDALVARPANRHTPYCRRGHAPPVVLSSALGRPLQSDPSRRMPSDLDIDGALRGAFGVVERAAEVLGVPCDELSEHVAASRLLTGTMQAAQRNVDATMEYHIRAGVVQGDVTMMAMRLKQTSDAGRGGGRTPGAYATAAASLVMDYTREVESAADLTDEELAAVIRRAALGEPPADGEVCRLCGRLGNGGAQEAVDSPADAEIVPDAPDTPDPPPSPLDAAEDARK